MWADVLTATAFLMFAWTLVFYVFDMEVFTGIGIIITASVTIVGTVLNIIASEREIKMLERTLQRLQKRESKI